MNPFEDKPDIDATASEGSPLEQPDSLAAEESPVPTSDPEGVVEAEAATDLETTTEPAVLAQSGETVDTEAPTEPEAPTESEAPTEPEAAVDIWQTVTPDPSQFPEVEEPIAPASDAEPVFNPVWAHSVPPGDEDEAQPLAAPITDSESAEEVEEAPPAPIDNPLMNWFIVHTYSGFENKVSESLRTRAEAFGFAERLGQILIPTEEVVEMRNGKKVTSKRLLYPGYVMVQMEMDDDLWHQVKNTPRVTGFIGGGGKPVPLTATEVNSILFRQSTAAERPRPKLSFDKNETVRIVDGPFANFSGKVDEINPERNTLRVMVTIFGRSTPVELDFLQVEKIA